MMWWLDFDIILVYMDMQFTWFYFQSIVISTYVYIYQDQYLFYY